MRSVKFSVYFLFLFCAATPGSDGLKDVRLDAPDYIRQGEDVTFSCQYDMEKDLLYAVKWYRGSEEFYRFVPKEVPPQQVFSIGRLDVDITSSTDHIVLLRNVSLDLSGLYKCVVSAESPFQTLSAVKEVRVVGIGYESPRLELDQMSYHPGDAVRANCTLEKTFPVPNVTWFINEREVRYSDILTGPWAGLPESGKPVLRPTVSRINLTLPEGFQPTKLSCRVQLYDIYDETVTKRIQPNPRHSSSITGPDTLPRLNNNATYPARSNSAQSNSHSHHFQIYNPAQAAYLLLALVLMILY